MSIDELSGRFRFFAGICAGQSPLYAALASSVADDPEVLRLATTAVSRQPPENLLFAAVHDRLLAGAEHALAEFYPSLGGTRSPKDAYPVFAEFCRLRADELVALVSSRRVQTNEVGRCGLLLPAFSLAWERLGRRPLHLVEVGSSTGLNLRFDHYRYEYTRGGTAGIHACGPESTARIRTRLEEGDFCPLPREMPHIAERTGVDIAPVDVRDAEAARWVEALIWPDQVDRIALFRAALALARAAPPHIVAGDGIDCVPGILASIPSGVVPCIFHSHATYQMSSAWRERFDALVAGLGRSRDLARVSLEWLGDDPGPQLHLTLHEGGARRTSHLADCHHHGAWMRWRSDDRPNPPIPAEWTPCRL